jgi:hypothetical protein
MPVPHGEIRRPTRPIGVQILAALLTVYAMLGVYIVATLLSRRPPEFSWWPVVGGAATFAGAAGASARAVWHLTASSPRWLLACGLSGAAFCITVAAAARELPDDARGTIWKTAVTGALLFFAFLAVAARYMRRQIDARS